MEVGGWRMEDGGWIVVDFDGVGSCDGGGGQGRSMNSLADPAGDTRSSLGLNMIYDVDAGEREMLFILIAQRAYSLVGA